MNDSPFSKTEDGNWTMSSLNILVSRNVDITSFLYIYKKGLETIPYKDFERICELVDESLYE